MEMTDFQGEEDRTWRHRTVDEIGVALSASFEFRLVAVEDILHTAAEFEVETL